MEKLEALKNASILTRGRVSRMVQPFIGT